MVSAIPSVVCGGVSQFGGCGRGVGVVSVGGTTGSVVGVWFGGVSVTVASVVRASVVRASVVVGISVVVDIVVVVGTSVVVGISVVVGTVVVVCA